MLPTWLLEAALLLDAAENQSTVGGLVTHQMSDILARHTDVDPPG
jgi:hypothetical protein